MISYSGLLCTTLAVVIGIINPDHINLLGTFLLDGACIV